MRQVDAFLPERIKNQYLYPKGLQTDIENFIAAHIDAHIHLPFQLIKKLNSNSSNIGFLEDSSKYFYSIDNTIYFQSLNDDNNSIEEIDNLTFQDEIFMISQFSEKPDIMAVNAGSITEIFNYRLKTSITLPLDPKQHLISWISTNSTPNLLSINEEGVLQVTDINKGESLRCEQILSFPRSISSHQTEPLVLLFGDTIQIVDLREGIALRELTPPPGCLCAEWLPKHAFGAGIGYESGKIELFNFETVKSVVSQDVGIGPIQQIDFYPRNGTFIMNFSSGSKIEFATLPAWGYGHFRIQGSYSKHFGNIKQMKWWKGEENPEYLRMISSDDKSFLHLYELESAPLLLYNPEL